MTAPSWPYIAFVDYDQIWQSTVKINLLRLINASITEYISWQENDYIKRSLIKKLENEKENY